MKEKNNDFNFTPKSIEEEFNTEYRKIQQLGNTFINLFRSFEDDNEFMQAFQNEFSNTALKPDVSKYWIGQFGEENVNATILKLKGIQSNIEKVPSEKELNDESRKFYNLIGEGKEPKKCYTHIIVETNIYQQFRNIENILNSFKEMKDFDISTDSLLQQAKEFGEGLISEIQNLNYEPIRTKIIETIINDKENINSHLNGFLNNNFNKKEFEDNYAKAKMYLDNYLKIYLETQVQTIKENNQSNTIEKKPTKKEGYLFKIGLKLALGELDEDLIIKEGNILLNTDLSFRKLADKYMLNEVYLKCTIANYTVSNQNKNLRNNPEIIKKVLTHLKSIGKEPKEWFLNEFETIVL
ncbi:hypothetical protein [Myroides sp. DF42-4-2]|uniref:hypothetical protein n=1 Tax=Myroides sp. DF42-4-2 TaxID=2746726 RepID=UPI002574BDF6|nr:hypothetical protein [Myroides sp. DF42-4-2]MDM1407438.1 hypothetical protein [Myroides sp. DF42-4-2]